jgi:hypothetical protein
MSDREPHCPFLNRADTRCSTFFSIEQLQHAFEHCFHAYKACSVYQELLVERQARRSAAATAGGPGSQFVWTTACGGGDPASRQKSHDGTSTTTTPRRSSQFVQVRIPSVAAVAAAHEGLAARADGYAKSVA